jgi:hypothetical protein
LHSRRQTDSEITFSAPVDQNSVVRSILDQCGITNLSIQDVATFEDGNVVALNLSNKDVSQDGSARFLRISAN